MRLLIVEDDSELRATLADALSEHAVTLVATALEALAAHPERFDAIVTDYRMPVMSGVELQRVLHERGVPVPMVLMSCDPDVGRLAKFFGFCDFLAKPFGFSQLRDMLERVGGPDCVQ